MEVTWEETQFTFLNLPTKEVRRTTCCSALCVKSLLFAKTPAGKALHLLLLSQNQHCKRRKQTVVGIQENTMLTWVGTTSSRAGSISPKFLVRTAANEMTKNNMQTPAVAWNAIPGNSTYSSKYRTVTVKTEQYLLKNCVSWQLRLAALINHLTLTLLSWTIVVFEAKKLPYISCNRKELWEGCRHWPNLHKNVCRSTQTKTTFVTQLTVKERKGSC